jgi:hypothetical protein
MAGSGPRRVTRRGAPCSGHPHLVLGRGPGIPPAAKAKTLIAARPRRTGRPDQDWTAPCSSYWEPVRMRRSPSCMSKRSDMWSQAQVCMSLARATNDPLFKERYEELAVDLARNAELERALEIVNRLEAAAPVYPDTDPVDRLRCQVFRAVYRKMPIAKNRAR